MSGPKLDTRSEPSVNSVAPRDAHDASSVRAISTKSMSNLPKTSPMRPMPKLLQPSMR